MGGEKGGSGLKLAAIVILIIVVLAGLYFWSQRSDSAEDALESIETQGTSDDAASIEADLDATDVENLDAEFNAS